MVAIGMTFPSGASGHEKWQEHMHQHPRIRDSVDSLLEVLDVIKGRLSPFRYATQ